MAGLQDFLGSNLLTFTKGMIEEWHLPAEDKAKFQAMADANAGAISQKQIELQEKYEDTYQAEVAAASANIRAEAATGDKFTSRARPSYIYCCELILILNYGVLPMLGKAPVPFPDALFYLFGICITGYVGARSWDKWAATKGA